MGIERAQLVHHELNLYIIIVIWNGECIIEYALKQHDEQSLSNDFDDMPPKFSFA